MYQRLLSSAGGGILSPSQQAEQNPCATIAIGLGGTGVECLRMLKREVYGRIRPDDPKAEVPSYRHVRFLSVDSDRSSMGKEGEPDALDWNTEVLDIGVPDPHALWAGLPMIRRQPNMQWLSPELKPKGSAGVGGVRQVGRLLLFQRCSQFIQKLTGLIVSAIVGLPSAPKLRIHIFTSLGGGTGSGIFLDVCYLVQYVLGTMGLQSMARVCGYFFLPDVNLFRVRMMPHVQDYIKRNGFAAMQELDYCMDFANNGGAWDQDYGNGVKIHTQRPPVDDAWLISSGNEDEVSSGDTYKTALYTVAQKVMEDLTAPSTPPIPSGKYGILGLCSAVLPFREITTYLAAKVFEGLGDLRSREPARKDVKEWIQGQGLDCEALLGALRQGIQPFPPVDDASLAEREKQLHTNSAALLAETGEASLIRRVQKSLIEIAGDVEKGPRYAAAMLHSLDGKDLSFWLDGCVTENGKYLAMARADMDLREKNLRETLERFQGANILNRRKRAQEYLKAIHQHFEGQFHIQEHEMMDRLLKGLREQLPRLYNRIFHPFAHVMEELQDTFRENLQYLSGPMARLPDNEMPILTVQDLRAALDQRVQAVSLPSLFRGLVEALLQKPGVWGNDRAFSHLVSSYFLEKMPALPYYTLDDCIPTARYGQIFADLRQRSAPLFSMNGNQALAHAPANQIQVLRVPDNCPHGAGEADFYALAQPGVFRQSSGEKDRVTCTSYWQDVPLSDYGGLDHCRRAYEELAKYPGVHLYEGTEEASRDWRKRLSSYPL